MPTNRGATSLSGFVMQLLLPVYGATLRYEQQVIAGDLGASTGLRPRPAA